MEPLTALRSLPSAFGANCSLEYAGYAHLDNEELLPVGSNVEEDALETSWQRHPAHQEGDEYDIGKQSWKYTQYCQYSAEEFISVSPFANNKHL